jgi:hypothetical protein
MKEIDIEGKLIDNIISIEPNTGNTVTFDYYELFLDIDMVVLDLRKILKKTYYETYK